MTTNYHDLNINLEAIYVRIDGLLYRMNTDHWSVSHLTPDLRMVSQNVIDMGGFVLVEDENVGA